MIAAITALEAAGTKPSHAAAASEPAHSAATATVKAAAAAATTVSATVKSICRECQVERDQPGEDDPQMRARHEFLHLVLLDRFGSLVVRRLILAAVKAAAGP